MLTPRFSPTAHEIAYLNYFNDEPNVYLLDVASGRTEGWAAFWHDLCPRFGPDGNNLIMSLASGRTDIFEMDLRTQTITQLTQSASIDTSPSYSPDGNSIVLIQIVLAPNSFTSCAVMAQMSTISFGGGRYATLVWSPQEHNSLQRFTRRILHWCYEC